MTRATYRKPDTCPLRRTKPIGPLTVCECDYKDKCKEISKEEIEKGMNKKRGNYPRTRPKDPNDPTVRKCPLCDKPIGRYSTPIHAVKGMFSIHMKAKHKRYFEAYKNGLIPLPS